MLILYTTKSFAITNLVLLCYKLLMDMVIALQAVS
jgi:hypothetical protein